MPIFKEVNSNFFKTWTPEMAYVLGFFCADGNMIQNKRGAHFIEFQITDKDLLYKIREVLKSNHKITERNRHINCKASYRLQIGSKEMFYDLIKLGLTPNKSLTVKLPHVPGKYFADFVRGYFDGDGNVTISNYTRKDRNNKKAITILSGFSCGSQEFLQNLKYDLEICAGIMGGTFNYGSRSYRLYFSVNDSLKLYKFMYNKTESGLFLERKKNRFENYFGVKVF